MQKTPSGAQYKILTYVMEAITKAKKRKRESDVPDLNKKRKTADAE